MTNNPYHQRGAATLVVSLILLLAITLVTFSSARVGVSEHRTSANDMRAKEALEVAQAGIEQTIALLSANKYVINSTQSASAGPPMVYDGWMKAGAVRWIQCANGDDSIPCGDADTSTPGTARGTGWMRYDKSAASYAFISDKLLQPSTKYNYDIDLLVQKDLNPAITRPANNPIVYITSTATSAGGDLLAGKATVTRIAKGVSTLLNPPLAPIMVAGTLPTTGNISIWGNSTPPGFDNPPAPPFTTIFYGAPDPLGTYSEAIPAGSGSGQVPGGIPALTGKPLSVWSAGAVTVSGSAQTCAASLPTNPPTSPIYSNCVPISYKKTGSDPTPSGCVLVNDPPGPGPSTKSFDCADYVQNVRFPSPAGTATVPPYFPDDVFYYTFGVPNANYLTVKNSATVLSDCGTLGSAPAGLYWVTGDCQLNSSVGNVGGTSTEKTGPIYLVVEGDLKMNSNIHFWGLIFMRGAGAVDLTGGPTLHGALVSDHNIDMGSGNFKAVYDATALGVNSPNPGRFAKVSGGWIDQAQ